MTKVTGLFRLIAVLQSLKAFKSKTNDNSKFAPLVQEGLVAQRITRLPTEQKIAGSNPV